MLELGTRLEPDLPAGVGEAAAQVDVLDEEKEAFVEPADLLEHLAPDGDGRHGHPVDLPRLVERRVGERVRAGAGVIGPHNADQTVQRRVTQLRERALRGLHGAVGVAHEPAYDAGARMIGDRLREGFDGLRRSEGVRVEQYHRVDLCGAYSLVRRRREAGVALVSDDADVGQRVGSDLGAPVRRRVVDEDDLRGAAGDRTQAIDYRGTGVVVDDYHAWLHLFDRRCGSPAR